ncbi:MAG: NADH-quinone oxidoreductase subunit N [Thermodesulfobacteriota bacterium]
MKAILFAPELYYLGFCLLLFLVSLGRSAAAAARNLALAGSVLGVGAVAACLSFEGSLFFDAYRVDLFSQGFKLAVAIGLAAVIIFGRGLKGVRPEVHAEFYMFMVLSALGLMMLVSSVELLTIFIALEVSSYSLYVLVPMRDDRPGLHAQMEAGVKYILFGAVATGVMLFGMSYIFGITGTTYLAGIMPKLGSLMGQPVAVVGMGMLLCGFFFKLAVFPFQFWVPDVYQGASNETAAYCATAPKLGAVALLIRLVTLAGPDARALTEMLMILSVASMFYGNLIALVQKDIKRMLGFSSVAHAGYVLIGILTLREAGYGAAIYYIAGYLIMNLACFLVICQVSRDGENVAIEDLEGLHQRSPILALTLAVGMFALAGIPPFVGFMGKFMLLYNALQEGYLWLVVCAAINTAISIYYYLSVVRVSYTKDANDRPAVAVDGLTRVLSYGLMALIVVMGLLPQRLVDMAATAMKGML